MKREGTITMETEKDKGLKKEDRRRRMRMEKDTFRMKKEKRGKKEE